MLKYCSNASCYKPVDWEGKEVKVKGHIDEHMLLIDVRNGYNIPISVDSSCKDTVFNKIIPSNNKKNMCYITGTLQSFEMPMMMSCDVGCNILLNSVDDIYFENKY